MNGVRSIADSRRGNRLIRCFSGNKPCNGRVKLHRLHVFVTFVKTLISVDHILPRITSTLEEKISFPLPLNWKIHCEDRFDSVGHLDNRSSNI